MPVHSRGTGFRPDLEALHERLSGVVIECLDWSAFITRYDGPNTLFYLDPPYWGCEDDYGKAMFGREDFARMAEQLQKTRGKFLLSINDVPEIREIFAAFSIEAVETTYTIGATNGKRVGEVLVSKGC